MENKRKQPWYRKFWAVLATVFTFLCFGWGNTVLSWVERFVSFGSGAFAEDAARIIRGIRTNWSQVPVLGDDWFQSVMTILGCLSLTVIAVLLIWEKVVERRTGGSDRKSGPLAFHFDKSRHSSPCGVNRVLYSVALVNHSDVRLDGISVRVRSIRAFGSGRGERQKKANGAVGVYLAAAPENQFERNHQPPATFSLNPGEERVVGVTYYHSGGAEFPICLHAATLVFPENSQWRWPHHVVLAAGGYDITFSTVDKTSVCEDFTVRINVTKRGSFTFKLLESHPIKSA